MFEKAIHLDGSKDVKYFKKKKKNQTKKPKPNKTASFLVL